LAITGYRADRQYANELEMQAAGLIDVTTDFRSEFLSPLELDDVIDRCDGVVLPYQNILNSGAAIHALSRNRPILAPFVGSLPELQRDVGPEWVQLYHGELEPAHLLSFVNHLRYKSADECDLRLYDWSIIEPAWCGFLRKVICG